MKYRKIRKFQKLSTPRWVIFIVDLFFCYCSLLLAYLLRFEYQIPASEIPQLSAALFPFGVIYAFGFYFGKTHTGMIRYTGSQDFKRIFSTLLGIVTFIFLGNYLKFFLLDKSFILPTTVLIIQFFVCLFLMISSRVAARVLLFDRFNKHNNKFNVIIYGAGAAGVISKRTLDRDAGTRYKVVAFIDDNPKIEKKRIEGISVYKSDDLATLLIQYQVERLIISMQQVDPMKKQIVVDQCLSHKVKVLNVPPVKNWINGELSFNQIRQINIEDLLGRPTINTDKGSLRSFFIGKKVLITGAAGSIGSEIARQVLAYGAGNTILLDQSETAIFEFSNELVASHYNNFETVIADITSKNRMRKVLAHYQPDIVYHAAAYKHVPLMEDNPAEAVRVNIKGTKNLVDLSLEYGVAEFVMISTDKAVNPTNVMGASKRVAEIYTQAHNGLNKTKFITTRFGNVLGSNGSVIPVFKKQIENGGPITVTHPDITRYFMTIPEACALVLDASLMGQGGEIFVFDMGESVKIVDLAKKMIQLYGLELGKDIEISFTGLRPGEKLYEELLIQEETTLPTHHPKILIGKVIAIELSHAKEMVDKVIDLIATQDNELIVKQLKQIVPEYQSKNSKFALLD